MRQPPQQSQRASFVSGLAAGVAVAWLCASLLPQENGSPSPSVTAPRSSAAASGAPDWLQRARELYGPYARLAEASYRSRVWIVPEERRAGVAEAKKALIARFRARNSARDTVGDFETLWHFGLMAPQGAQLVEVGTCSGGGAMTIATAAKAAGNGARVLSADLYERGWLVRMGYCISTDQWKKLAVEFGVSELTEPRGFCSSEVAHSLADGSVDGVFVDAEHHFEEVYNDISRWWPKLKSDGLMIGHDAFTHLGNAIALADAVALKDPGNLKLLERVGTHDTTFKAQGAAASGSGYGNCPQGAHVTLAALRYAQEQMDMEFGCCMPNSSIWHYKRFHTADIPRLKNPAENGWLPPAGTLPREKPRPRAAYEGPAPDCPVDPMQKKKRRK